MPFPIPPRNAAQLEMSTQPSLNPQRQIKPAFTDFSDSAPKHRSIYNVHATKLEAATRDSSCLCAVLHFLISKSVQFQEDSFSNSEPGKNSNFLLSRKWT
jgi:hypothetical protein